jgi:hypothetical protein
MAMPVRGKLVMVRTFSQFQDTEDAIIFHRANPFVLFAFSAVLQSTHLLGSTARRSICQNSLLPLTRIPSHRSQSAVPRTNSDQDVLPSPFRYRHRIIQEFGCDSLRMRSLEWREGCDAISRREFPGALWQSRKGNKLCAISQATRGECHRLHSETNVFLRSCAIRERNVQEICFNVEARPFGTGAYSFRNKTNAQRYM